MMIKKCPDLLSTLLVEKDRIENDNIEGYSIKYSQTKLDVWTLACKHFLITLQWMIYMSALHDKRELDKLKGVND